ncbi:MAG: hypothetical protein KIS96_08530 [Bauldia sp.]|nr:hypothetical protein [Bauldia sp.]
MDTTLHIPFPRDLYDDIIRFSDGRLDPVRLAEEQVRQFVARTVQSSPELWGEAHLRDVAVKYAPDALVQPEAETRGMEESATQGLTDAVPLVWKGVTIPAGSEVRMSYGRGDHFGRVVSGRIMDRDGAFSPSEWASKVAGGTSRNAWRDLWFRLPGATNWLPATMLREKAKAEFVRAGGDGMPKRIPIAEMIARLQQLPQPRVPLARDEEELPEREGL